MTFKDDTIQTPQHLNRKKTAEYSKDKKKVNVVEDQWVELTYASERGRPAKVILHSLMSSGHTHRSYQGRVGKNEGDHCIEKFKKLGKYFPNGKPKE